MSLFWLRLIFNFNCKFTNFPLLSLFHPWVNRHLEIFIYASFSSIRYRWLARSTLTHFRYAHDGNISAYKNLDWLLPNAGQLASKPNLCPFLAEHFAFTKMKIDTDVLLSSFNLVWYCDVLKRISLHDLAFEIIVLCSHWPKYACSVIYFPAYMTRHNFHYITIILNWNYTVYIPCLPQK
jgi:hypothetical protein